MDNNVIASSDLDFQRVNRLPGEQYTPDIQCQLALGSQYKAYHSTKEPFNVSETIMSNRSVSKWKICHSNHRMFVENFGAFPGHGQHPLTQPWKEVLVVTVDRSASKAPALPKTSRYQERREEVFHLTRFLFLELTGIPTIIKTTTSTIKCEDQEGSGLDHLDPSFLVGNEEGQKTTHQLYRLNQTRGKKHHHRQKQVD